MRKLPIFAFFGAAALSIAALSIIILPTLPSNAETLTPQIFSKTKDITLYGQPVKPPENAIDESPRFTLYQRKGTSKEVRLTENDVVEAAQHNDITYFIDADTRTLTAREASGKTATLIKPILGFNISPDGKHATYQKLNPDWKTGELFDGAQGLHILDLTTNQERQLTKSWEDFGAFWSPDNTRIFYYAPNDESYVSLWSINPDGTNKIQHTNLPGTAKKDRIPAPSEKPQWSTDGKQLTTTSDGQTWIITIAR